MIDERFGNSKDTASEGISVGADRIGIDDADQEIEAMRVVARILAPLDQETRNRVLSWVERRLSPAYKSAAETPEQRRHREAVERGRQSWISRRARE